MKRGEIITVTISGDYGKPRPALVIQSDLFDQHPSVTILPVTSELREAPLFRYAIEPGKSNGLNKASQVMIDKITTIKSEKAGDRTDNLSANDGDYPFSCIVGRTWLKGQREKIKQ